MSKITLLLAAFFILAVEPAWPAFEDLGAGARAPGMGNAFTALSDDVYAIYYNPAGLAQMERAQFSSAYSKLFMGLSDGSDLSLSQLAYAHPLKNGRAGTLGVGWQHFGASSLYTEDTIHLSYGRMLLQRDNGSRLLGGLNIKQLKHSFGRPAEASNACNNGICNNGDDPVLTGNNSKNTFDADMGFIYRLPRRVQLGLAVQHVMQPDVGFAQTDKLPMSIRFGAAYKSLWMSLVGEIRQEKAPTGTTDRDIIVAGERIFATLDNGQFGLRGSMAFGNREFKQITTGLSYRVNKIQIDYGFLMPLSGIKGTQGSHRVAFSWHFGAPTPDDEITNELLEQARQMREGRGPSYGYEYAEELRPYDIDDPKIADVRSLIDQRYYRKAHELVKQMIQNQTPTPPMVRLANRLELISYYYPDLAGPRTKQWENLAISAIDNFLHGKDRVAMLRASYALSLSRNDVQWDNLVTKMEEAISIKADRLPADHPRSFIDELLFRAEAANNRGEADTVDSTLQNILDLDPANPVAVERVGSMYYILGRYQEAVDVWQKAIPLEKRIQDLENLQRYIQLAKERLGSGKLQAALPGTPAEAAPSPAQPQQSPAPAALMPPATATQAPLPQLQEPAPAPAQAPAVTPVVPVEKVIESSATAPAPAAQPRPKPRPAAKPKPVAAAAGDPRDVERLFQKGVEHYARGEYLQATAMFMRILQIDPQNAQARKALDRIENRSSRKKAP